MKYRVPMRISFDGCALIEAPDEEAAELIAVSHLTATLGNISDNNNDKIKDFVFNTSGYTERLDNESIEEVEDEDDEKY